MVLRVNICLIQYHILLDFFRLFVWKFFTVTMAVKYLSLLWYRHFIMNHTFKIGYYHNLYNGNAIIVRSHLSWVKIKIKMRKSGSYKTVITMIVITYELWYKEKHKACKMWLWWWEKKWEEKAYEIIWAQSWIIKKKYYVIKRILLPE